MLAKGIYDDPDDLVYRPFKYKHSMSLSFKFRLLFFPSPPFSLSRSPSLPLSLSPSFLACIRINSILA